MNKKIKFLIPLLLIPNIVGAKTFAELTKDIYTSFVPMFTDLLLTFAVVFFVWGIFKFVVSDGDKKESAKNRLVWATIALFVMLSFWGILRVVNSTFFTNDLGEGNYKVNVDFERPEFKGRIKIPS